MTFQLVESCKTSEKTSDKSTVSSNEGVPAVDVKSGAQLWGENCVRCHNAPPPQAYSNEQWNVIGKHMRIRANISQKEMDNIIDFIKSSN